MSDVQDLPRIWQAPGMRLVRGRWSSTEGLVPDRGGPTAAPAALASEAVLAKEWGDGRIAPSCMALLVDEPIAQQIDAKALAAQVKALDPSPAPQLMRVVQARPDFLVFLTDTGANLAFRLEEWRFLGWEEAGRNLIELAHALAGAHLNGLTAGHLEPYHVHLGPENTVNLALPGPEISLKARLLGLGGKSAALALAPELVAGGAPTPASDVFSLGALYLHMVCGRAPLTSDLELVRDGASLEALAYRMRGREFDLPRRVLEFIVSLTDPEPGNRPAVTELPDRMVAVSAGQIESAVRLIHGETKNVDLTTGLLKQPVKEEVTRKPGIIGRLAATVVASTMPEVPAMPRTLPPPPSPDGTPAPAPALAEAERSSFWEGAPVSRVSEPEPVVTTKGLPSIAELRAQVQAQLKEDASPAPKPPVTDVGELPAGADREAAERFLREMQPPPPATKARAPSRPSATPIHKAMAMLVILGILLWLVAVKFAPQIANLFNGVMPNPGR